MESAKACHMFTYTTYLSTHKDLFMVIQNDLHPRRR